MKIARTNGHRRGRSRNSSETFVERVWLVPVPHLGSSILIGSLPFLQGCRLVIIAATLAVSVIKHGRDRRISQDRGRALCHRGNFLLGSFGGHHVVEVFTHYSHVSPIERSDDL